MPLFYCVYRVTVCSPVIDGHFTIGCHSARALLNRALAYTICVIGRFAFATAFMHTHLEVQIAPRQTRCSDVTPRHFRRVHGICVTALRAQRFVLYHRRFPLVGSWFIVTCSQFRLLPEPLHLCLTWLERTFSTGGNHRLGISDYPIPPTRSAVYGVPSFGRIPGRFTTAQFCSILARHQATLCSGIAVVLGL